MRTHIAKWLCAGILMPWGMAWAQMDVDMTLDHNVYIVGEPIRADVTLANHATIPLVTTPNLTSVRNGLSFDIRVKNSGSLAPLRPGTPLLPDCVVLPGEKHSLAFNLDEWYPMHETGRYLISAQIKFENRRYDSAIRMLDIVPGIELQSAIQLFSDRPNEQRNLALVYWARKDAEYLFLRVNDTPGDRTWTTLELGNLLRVTPPTLSVSPEGDITILHRATKDFFLRTHVKSTSREVVLVGQERLIDQRTLDTLDAERMMRAHDEKAKAEKASSAWWWPFGSGGTKSNNDAVQ